MKHFPHFLRVVFSTTIALINARWRLTTAHGIVFLQQQAELLFRCKDLLHKVKNEKLLTDIEYII